MTKGIGYSEGAAQRRIQSARLLKQVPEIAKDLQTGELNLSQISYVQTAIRQEEKCLNAEIPKSQKLSILNKLKSQNTFETQKILMQELPSFEVPKPKAVPTAHNKIQVTLEFHEKDWEKIQKLMAHFSHAVPDQKLESFLLWCHANLEKKKLKQKMNAQKLNNVKKQEIGQKKKFPEIERMKEVIINSAVSNEKGNHTKSGVDPIHTTEKIVNNSLCSMENQVPFLEVERVPKSKSNNLKSPDILPPKRRWSRLRQYIPQAIQTKVRSQGQCEFVSRVTGRKCLAKHFLEIEHIRPLAKGGTNHVSNLRLYCRAHNQLVAKNWGLAKAPIES